MKQSRYLPKSMQRIIRSLRLGYECYAINARNRQVGTAWVRPRRNVIGKPFRVRVSTLEQLEKRGILESYTSGHFWENPDVHWRLKGNA